MKSPLIRMVQILSLVVGTAVFDATLLEGKLWTELKYQTTSSVAGLEPGAKWVWPRIGSGD